MGCGVLEVTFIAIATIATKAVGILALGGSMLFIFLSAAELYDAGKKWGHVPEQMQARSMSAIALALTAFWFLAIGYLFLLGLQ